MSKLAEQTKAKAIKLKGPARADFVREEREKIGVQIKALRVDARALSAVLAEFEPKPDKSHRGPRASYVIEKA